MYDVAIIGSGPAGMSAALNLKLHGKSIIWFGSKELSTKVQKSEKIANYPGVPMVSGNELNRIFAGQIKEAGLEITDQIITNIMPLGNGFSLLGANEIFEAKTVLLAIGASGGKGFPGEDKLLGRGVSYCATCDGFLYKGKTIAVYCGAPKYEHEVEYLAELADKVYLFAPYKDCKISLSKVQRPNKPMAEILGEDKVRSAKLTDGSEIEVDGIFILRDSVAPSNLMSGIELDGVHIEVDGKMQTNIPGCFAAGDCTGRPYQIATAVGEGNAAAHSIIEYLSK
jgi:thioredoxin reductase (NADPH)